MNRKQKKRMTVIVIILLLISTAIALALFALKQNINLFYTPTQLLTAQLVPEQTIRVGGYVKKGSVQFDAKQNKIHFTVTDHTNDVAVYYEGILPNLFKDEQGIVVAGKFNANHLFVADQVLAKHDEKYMPWTYTKALTAPKTRQ